MDVERSRARARQKLSSPQHLLQAGGEERRGGGAAQLLLRRVKEGSVRYQDAINAKNSRSWPC